jgi:hypothetical protein
MLSMWRPLSTGGLQCQLRFCPANRSGSRWCFQENSPVFPSLFSESSKAFRPRDQHGRRVSAKSQLPSSLEVQAKNYYDLDNIILTPGICRVSLQTSYYGSHEISQFFVKQTWLGLEDWKVFFFHENNVRDMNLFGFYALDWYTNRLWNAHYWRITVKSRPFARRAYPEESWGGTNQILMKI